MTQNEIVALINAKIAGQGSVIDIGGALPVILSALAGAAWEGHRRNKTISEWITIE